MSEIPNYKELRGIMSEECCNYYQIGLDKLNAIIVLQSVRRGSSVYDGKPWNYCPWCGATKSIMTEAKGER